MRGSAAAFAADADSGTTSLGAIAQIFTNHKIDKDCERRAVKCGEEHGDLETHTVAPAPGWTMTRCQRTGSFSGPKGKSGREMTGGSASTVTQGVSPDANASASFVRGVSTEQDVNARLGKPLKTVRNIDGTTTVFDLPASVEHNLVARSISMPFAFVVSNELSGARDLATLFVVASGTAGIVPGEVLLVVFRVKSAQ
jgi:hypothetical protein